MRQEIWSHLASVWADVTPRHSTEVFASRVAVGGQDDCMFQADNAYECDSCIPRQWTHVTHIQAGITMGQQQQQQQHGVEVRLGRVINSCMDMGVRLALWGTHRVRAITARTCAFWERYKYRRNV